MPYDTEQPNISIGVKRMKPIIKWQTHTTEATEKDHTFETLDDGKAWCEQTLQRWINASFDSVITQPVDATERLTLVEKLGNKRKEWASNPHYWMDSNLIGDVFSDIIRTVKQHQSWRKMPSDEKPQDMQAYNLLLKNDSAEYPTLYSVGLFRQYASGHVWVSLVEAEKYIDESKILAWQPMNELSNDFFESLEQPPREPQYLISKGGYWYRPNAKGYTASKHEAGRFSKEFAERHAKEVPEVRIFEDKENE